MKRQMNVLSIDYDYFQIVDEDTLACYPDGHDFGIEMSKCIWASHYAFPSDAEMLFKVKVDEEKLEHVQRIIQDSWDIGTKVMICNSHKNIYKFIKDAYYENEDDYDGVNIVNIDMHHDMFNDNPNLDCGNWISHIIDDIGNSCVTWIANPISKVAYGMDEEKFSMVSENLDDAEYIDYDVIFLCRSDIWSPPHLDQHFSDLANSILEQYYNVLIESKILEERDLTKEIHMLKSSIENFTSKCS